MNLLSNADLLLDSEATSWFRNDFSNLLEWGNIQKSAKSHGRVYHQIFALRHENPFLYRQRHALSKHVCVVFSGIAIFESMQKFSTTWSGREVLAVPNQIINKLWLDRTDEFEPVNQRNGLNRWTGVCWSRLRDSRGNKGLGLWAGTVPDWIFTLASSTPFAIAYKVESKSPSLTIIRICLTLWWQCQRL